MKTKTNTKNALILILGVIAVAVTYQFLALLPVDMQILDPIGAVYNLVLTGVLALVVLKREFAEWFRHFSVKWTLLTVPSLIVASLVCGKLWQMVSGGALTENAINSMLTWKYVITHTPFMLMGEETGTEVLAGVTDLCSPVCVLAYHIVRIQCSSNIGHYRCTEADIEFCF